MIILDIDYLVNTNINVLITIKLKFAKSYGMLIIERNKCMIFVCDLDDTICETDKFSENYIAKFIKENNLPYKKIANNVRFAERNFDWDKETALEWYKKYGDQMMLEFPCKKDAILFLNQIHNLGHKIIIATARATDWHTDPEGITMSWLVKNNIPFDKVYIGRYDKEKICEEENADVFIDDDLGIAERVANYFNKSSKAKKVFLMTSDYNKNIEEPKGVIRVKNFDEIKVVLNYK